MLVNEETKDRQEAQVEMCHYHTGRLMDIKTSGDLEALKLLIGNIHALSDHTSWRRESELLTITLTFLREWSTQYRTIADDLVR